MYRRQAVQNLFNCYNCRQINAKTPITPEEEECLVTDEAKLVKEIIECT